MTSTNKLGVSLKIVFALLIGTWLIFIFLPQTGPVTQTTADGISLSDPALRRMTINGVMMTALALFILISAALMKQGRLKPDSWWGRSAAYQLWFGLGFLLIGLSHLSHLVLGNTIEASLQGGKLQFYASIIALGLILLGVYKARMAKAS